MGSRGPLPKTKDAIRFLPGVPAAPCWLDADARREYVRIAKLLTGDHLQQVDLSTLSTYAQAYADVKRLTKQVREEGETLTSKTKGTSYLNPKCSALSAAYNRMRESATKLMFSPADRARGSGRATKPSSTEDPVSRYV